MPILILILSIFLTGCASKKGPAEQGSVQVDNSSVGFVGNQVLVLEYPFFKIEYDTDLRLARAVTYQLSGADLKKKTFARKDNFKSDPKLIELKRPYVKPNEYARTGYDKGHLAPAADFSWSTGALDLTFIMSNMAPQLPGLNRDSWRRLEDKVRRWACGEGKITVITGPIIKGNEKRLKSGLPIPAQFFKIVIDETAPRKVISFIYNQTDRGDLIRERITSFKLVSELTSFSLANYKMPKNEGREPANLTEWKEADCK